MNALFVFEEAAKGGGWGQFALIGVMIVAMVVMFIFTSRSNKKKEKEEKNMRDALQVGDEITTIGGIIGKIVSIKEETMVIETTRDHTRIRLLKSAVRSVDVPANVKIEPAEENEAANDKKDDQKQQ